MTDPAGRDEGHHHDTSPDAVTDPSVVAGMWDERYSADDRIWSGEPNGALVAEAQVLSPGRVLDVGCGEGADAVWLALRGWDVTALDVSGVALQRAEAAAVAAGANVTWLHAGLLDAGVADSGFDLVSAQYPALARTPGRDAERALLATVAPGGTLLFVHHAQFGTQPAEGQGDNSEHTHAHAHTTGHGEGNAHGFRPQDFVGPADVAAVLGDDWQVEADELRPRNVQSGAGAGHTEDVVLRAKRLR
ncbi:MAG: class I SAM-dependent methyltransferase [Actinomycetes bacterium]